MPVFHDFPWHRIEFFFRLHQGISQDVCPVPLLRVPNLGVTLVQLNSVNSAMLFSLKWRLNLKWRYPTYNQLTQKMTFFKIKPVILGLPHFKRKLMPFTTTPNLSVASQWMAPMWSAPKPHCHRVNFCQHHLLADLCRFRSITLPSDSWQGQPPKCGHLELPGAIGMIGIGEAARDAIGLWAPKNRTSKKTLGTSWHNKVPGNLNKNWRIWLYPHKRTLTRLAEIRKCCSCMFMHVHAWPSLRSSPAYGSKLDHQSPHKTGLPSGPRQGVYSQSSRAIPWDSSDMWWQYCSKLY